MDYVQLARLDRSGIGQLERMDETSHSVVLCEHVAVQVRKTKPLGDLYRFSRIWYKRLVSCIVLLLVGAPAP